MKKSIRILSLVLAVVMLSGMALTLVACGNKLSGEYEHKDPILGIASVTLKFSGSKVSISGDVKLLSAILKVDDGAEIEYKIVDKDDSQVIQFFIEDGKDPIELPFSQNKDEKTITIAKILTFKKK